MRLSRTLCAVSILGLAGCSDLPRRDPEVCPALVVPEMGALACENLACSDGECPEGALWGYADLHTHPASHFAMGADTSGTNGPFYGAPDGPVLTDGTPASAAIPACDGGKHYNPPDAPLDTLITETYSALESSGGANHQPSGVDNDYASWPSARSPTHQQMHVEWLHRARNGGLRLIVASVTDNQVFETLWTRQFGISWADDLDPSGADGRDVASARRQLGYIRAMVDNHDWMEIVRSPEEAECSIRNGKLAVVLALEMDSLTTDQIVELAREEHVRMVTPIHMRDHPEFGGMAVYQDLLNTSSRALNTAEEFVSIRDESTVAFRYGAPSFIGDFPLLGFSLFANQVSIKDHPGDACDIGYQTCASDALLGDEGHANALGLRATGSAAMRDLMGCGLIVDVAHMSDRSMDSVLTLASEYEVPVVDSHTDLRGYIGEGEGQGDPQQVSERALRRDLAERIGDGGGMVGLGTVGDMGLKRIARDDADAFMVFHADRPLRGPRRWTPDQPFLRVMVRNGPDGLRDEATVLWSVDNPSATNGVFKEYRDHELKEVGTFEDNGVDWVDLRLPAGTTASDLSRLRLELRQEACAGCTSENWNLEGIEVYLYEPDSIILLAQAHGAVNRFTESDPDWSIGLAADPRDVLDIQLWTGADDLRCGSWARLRLELNNGAPVVWTDVTGSRLTPHDGMPNHSFFRRPVALPAGYERNHIRSVGLERHDEESCGAAHDADNWNLEAIRIEARAATGRDVYVDRHGWTVHRFSETHSALSLPVLYWFDERPLRGRYLWLTIGTGSDDLRDGNTAEAWVSVGGAETRVDLNDDTLWGNQSVHKVLVDLGAEVDLTALDYVDIDMRGPVHPDTWRVTRLELHAVGTPIETWWSDYLEIQRLLGGRGVGFGSDLNGFEIQLPVSEVAPAYPLQPVGDPDGRNLERQMLGSRTADFEHDGLSNIGQLPDWVGAIEALDPATPNDTHPLYTSAKEFVEMWYRVRENAASVP